MGILFSVFKTENVTNDINDTIAILLGNETAEDGPWNFAEASQNSSELPFRNGSMASENFSFTFFDCGDTRDLLRIPWFWTGLSFHVMLSPTAILFNLILLLVLLRKSLLPMSVRILLGNISFWCILGAACLLAKTIYTFVQSVHNPCALTTDLLCCKTQEIALFLAELMILASILAIGIERTCVTRTLNSADEKVDKGLAGQALTLFIWTLSIAALVVGFFSIKSSESDLAHCNSMFTYEALEVRVLCLVLLGLDLLSVVLYSIVWGLTKKIDLDPHKRSGFSLSWQAARKRNIQVTMMMFPTVVVHFVIWVLILVLTTLQMEFFTLAQMHTHLIASEFVLHDLALLCMTLHPLLVIWASEPVRREMRQCCSCFRLCVSPDAGAGMRSGNRGTGGFDYQGELEANLWVKPVSKKETARMEELKTGLLSADTHYEEFQELDDGGFGRGGVRDRSIDPIDNGESSTGPLLQNYQYRPFDGAPIVREESGLAHIEDDY